MDIPMKNIKEPSNNDVLFGRGRNITEHPGNEKFRSLVAKRSEDHSGSDAEEKEKITVEILEHIRKQQHGGRFLKKDEKTGLWNDVGDHDARQKIAACFRSYNRKQKKGHEQNENIQPACLKRETSHQNEDDETKSEVKKANRNRSKDHSEFEDYLTEQEENIIFDTSAANSKQLPARNESSLTFLRETDNRAELSRNVSCESRRLDDLMLAPLTTTPDQSGSLGSLDAYGPPDFSASSGSSTCQHVSGSLGSLSQLFVEMFDSNLRLTNN